MEDEYGPRTEPPPPRYSILNGGDPPPPPTRHLHHNSQRRSGCVSGLFCFLFVVPVVIIIGVVAIFFVIHNSMHGPSFSIEGIAVRELELNASDFTLRAKMVASLRAVNENSKFGFSYRQGSRVSVVYRKTTLCQGRLPDLYQAPSSNTHVNVVMEGHRRFDERLQAVLSADQEARRIPVKFYLRAPLTLRIGSMDVTEMVINVAVSAVVSSLSPSSTIDINNADSKYDHKVQY